jgi:hypothetical protein
MDKEEKNLERWKSSGDLKEWLRWNSSLEFVGPLLRDLRNSKYWPMHEGAIGKALVAECPTLREKATERLFHAVRWGPEEDVIRLLLGAGADVNSTKAFSCMD